ncbi:Peroxisomal 2,4-dienoyl-CoA reductase [Apostasia shenzhenica]|uniref:2,4-dienoyl-CoA reductase [(3E)-enoyl-CoA-producing] n=1 Tax=Apostasia shenzhenica TaxID=1088818 RepID=A0A2I0B2S7_9ASPA|nr:Peroxisomal 2,4-dienoyl-CoA reductase [Apostasia shenzhenica]
MRKEGETGGFMDGEGRPAMESPFKADILKGKVALVTGGGSGIGLEISTQLGKHGAAVAIMGRRLKVLDDAIAVLQSLGIRMKISGYYGGGSGFTVGTQKNSICRLNYG